MQRTSECITLRRGVQWYESVTEEDRLEFEKSTVVFMNGLTTGFWERELAAPTSTIRGRTFVDIDASGQDAVKKRKMKSW